MAEWRFTSIGVGLDGVGTLVRAGVDIGEMLHTGIELKVHISARRTDLYYAGSVGPVPTKNMKLLRDKLVRVLG